MNCLIYKDTIIFHPGYYIEEIMIDKSCCVEDLAHKVNLPVDVTQRIIDGLLPVTTSIARHLSLLCCSPECWRALQCQYNHQIHNIKLNHTGHD